MSRFVCIMSNLAVLLSLCASTARADAPGNIYVSALQSARPQAEPVAGTWRGLRGERVQDGDMSLPSLLFYGSTAYKHTDVEATVGNTKLKCASFSGGGGCPRVP